MSEIKCEDAILSAMAEFDGEEPPVTAEKLKMHFDGCENCRREIAQMQKTFGLLQAQTRREQSADLWHSVEKQIEPQQTGASPQIGWNVFAFLAAFLVAYKLLEMLSAEDFGFLFKLVPLVFVVALFGFLRENPFKINTQLTLEK